MAISDCTLEYNKISPEELSFHNSLIFFSDPGAFEFSKPSFVFKTSAGSGHVPVVRSNGTDGQVTLPWRIVSRDERSESPFAGMTI